MSLAVNSTSTPLREPEPQARGSGSCGEALSPLASEVLADLAKDFPHGASARMLQRWLGESRPVILEALGELVGAGHVFIRDLRYFAGPRRPRGGVGPNWAPSRVAELLKLKGLDLSHPDIAKKIGVSTSSVGHKLRRLRQESKS